MSNIKIPMNELETTKMLAEKNVTYYSFDWSTYHEQTTLYLFIPHGGLSDGMQKIKDEFLEKGWMLKLIPDRRPPYELVNNML